MFRMAITSSTVAPATTAKNIHTRGLIFLLLALLLRFAHQVEASCLMKTGHSTHRGFETEGLLNTGFAHQRQVLEAFRQQIASIESG